MTGKAGLVWQLLLFNIVSWSSCLTENYALDILLKQLVTSKLVSPRNVYMNRHNFKKQVSTILELVIFEDSTLINPEIKQIWPWQNLQLAKGIEEGTQGGSCHEVTIVNFWFHESQNKKFSFHNSRTVHKTVIKICTKKCIL